MKFLRFGFDVVAAAMLMLSLGAGLQGCWAIAVFTYHEDMYLVTLLMSLGALAFVVLGRFIFLNNQHLKNGSLTPNYLDPYFEAQHPLSAAYVRLETLIEAHDAEIERGKKFRWRLALWLHSFGLASFWCLFGLLFYKMDQIISNENYTQYAFVWIAQFSILIPLTFLMFIHNWLYWNLNPRICIYFINRAALQANLGKTQQLILDSHPYIAKTGIYFLLGGVYQQQGQLELARELFQKAGRTPPPLDTERGRKEKLKTILFHLAANHILREHFAQGRELVGFLEALYPNEASTYYYKAELLLETHGFIPEVIENLDFADSLNRFNKMPITPDNQLMRAWALYRQGENEAAEARLQACLASTPHTWQGAVSYYYAGLALLASPEPERARAYFEQAVVLGGGMLSGRLAQREIDKMG
jgi:tetratricopeptide (TPR) repeat protein